MLALAGCHRPGRAPIGRGDAGPAVVVVDRHVEPETLGPRSPEVEPNDSVAQAQPLDVGARIAGELASDKDVDLYQLRSVTAPTPDLGGVDGGTGPLSLAFVSAAPTEGAVVLELVDGKGRTVLSRSAPVAQKATLSYLRLDPAGAIVRVRAPKSKGATPSPVAYTLEYLVRTIGPDAEPQPEVEPNDQPAQAGALPARGTLTGRLDGDDDRDLVLLPFEPEGTTFRVELAAIAELALEVRLRSAKDVLSVARGGKGGELRLRNLPASPTVPLYLALRAVDGTSDTPYTLRVSTEPPLGDAAVEREPNDTVARANPLTPGGSVAGYLWPGDMDMYCAKEGLVFGARVDPLPDVDFRLELTDAAGKALHKADTGKRGAAEELPPDPRARCVRLSARSHDTAFETPYRLTFTE